MLSKADSLKFYDALKQLKEVLNLASYISTQANTYKILDKKYHELLNTASIAGGEMLNRRKINNGN
ncbi:hypothetical protein PAT01_03610 [Pseudoalteromonas atlantica]|uniref:Uncharacterized protein n=1 Tax=Pseudoalteromonas atlantica TaxID=288 RepID=A0ABQ0U9C7_PSEAF|nr:hypothetical protein PAT01_03610 [Pseudoalteromonas atlantica]